MNTDKVNGENGKAKMENWWGRAKKLGLGTREAGAGAGGHAAGVTLRAIVGLVAGDVHFEQGAGGDVEFEASAAAVDDGAGGYRQAAFLFDYADGFAGGAACGPDVFDDEDAFTGLQLEAAAQRHLAGGSRSTKSE